MNPIHTPILIIGAGVAGIATGAMLRRRGITDFTIVDRGRTFGGTWRDNVYPGVECDVQSHLYSYSFRHNPRWSKTYAGGAEINEYLVTVADEEGLGQNTIFNRSVSDIRWDPESRTWRVRTDHEVYVANFVITATGSLAEPKMPKIPGIEDFGGRLMHSAVWDSSVDLTGKKIAVIGTGASAIQVVPAIAGEVESLTVFQRTPPWVVPRVDVEYSEAQKRMWENLPDTLDEYRQFLFWFHETRFPERARAQAAIDRMTRIADNHRLSQIQDPNLREATRPTYAIGCKRILNSNEWYPALQRDNVELVPHAADRISPEGIIDATGTERSFDVVIVCTGYDTAGLPISRIVRGDDGALLSEVWAEEGARAYGGMSVDGFPNFFFVNGPHVGLGFGSIIFMIETQAAHVADALRYAIDSDVATIRVRPERQESFAAFTDDRASRTVWLTGGCDSFYLSDRSGRLTTLWPDFMTRFSDDFRSFNADDYLAEPAEKPISRHLEQSAVSR
jgi:cation diffusion facilitator CzcD-associated flavoprotein CzcO